MNHTEPLSWVVPPLQVGLAADERELLLQQHEADLMSHAVRSTFRVIATYLEGCRQSVPAAVLAGFVHGARELGRLTYEIALERDLIDHGPLRRDWMRCLENLEPLAISLSGGATPPRWELVHALDTLIGLLIRLDGSTRESITAAPAPTLTCHSNVRGKARLRRQVGDRPRDATQPLASRS